MKVLNLCCSNEHRFEGWFASVQDFQSQSDRTLIACPLCGDTTITKLPSAPHVHVSSSREVVVPAETAAAVTPPAAPPKPTPMTLQAAWMQAVRHVMANTEDVGERFAEEARRMHYGEIDERAIRGRTTGEEARALMEEGIEVMPFALPQALKGTVQ